MMAYNFSDWDKVWIFVKSQGIGMLGDIADIKYLDDRQLVLLQIDKISKLVK